MSDVAADRLNRPLIGILAIVAAILVFSGQDAVVKLLSNSYSVWQIVFVRSVVATLLVVTFAAFAKGGVNLRTRRPGLQIYRGLLMLGSYTFYYLGIIAMPLVDGAAIFFASPLFITVLSIPLLGERVGVHRGLAVAAGFVGVVIMLGPGVELFRWAAVMPLLGALTYAYSAIVTRRLGETESSLSITFYTMTVFAAGSAAGSAVWVTQFSGGGVDANLVLRWVFPGAADLAVMALLGLVASIGHFCITHAYRVAPVSIVAPFEYTYLPWAALLGYLVWDDVPAPHTLLGLALVVGGGLYVMWREGRGRLRAARPLATAPSDIAPPPGPNPPG